MATTRVNGLGHAHATLYSTAQLKAFVIDAGATLASQGGIGGAIEALAQYLQPLMIQSTGTAGAVHVIMDGVNVDAATLQANIRALGTINGYDFSGATCTLGTSIVVS
jgi:hypothetical protein